MEVQELKPNRIWKYFAAINAIPRASTKEKRITNHMIAFGESLKLETQVDAIGNVIIKKPATKNKQFIKTVVLQGHLDMVHQKTESSTFDFDKQGIEMYVDGDWVKAKETTLGADNGIGVAAIMAVLSSNDIEHPPIEALFTVDEEMGMTGAMALTKDQLKGGILLNLDSEEDDEITIGCAGGVDVEINGFYDLESLNGEYQYYEIRVAGLTGGHSGVDIHLNHANAIKIFAEYLKKICDVQEIHISSIECHGLTNVIPRVCTGIIAVKKSEIQDFEKLSTTITQHIKEEFATTDAALEINVNTVNGSFFVADQDFYKAFLSGLLNTPNGVYKMTDGTKGLVQSSNSIAILSLKDGVFNIACHTRSSLDAERSELVEKIKHSFPIGNLKEIGPYPGWEPKTDSKLLHTAVNCYKKINGVKPNIKSIHAGLECGILSGTFPNMEMISFGPNVLGAHSPEERLQISSTHKFWIFLVEILKTI
jgi:dipeptidase D